MRDIFALANVIVRGLLAPLMAMLAIAGADAFTASPATKAEPYRWRNVAVGGGGFSPNIVFSRAEPNLAYLRTDMGGAYRWDDGAGQWVPLQDSTSVSSYLGIESLAPDPVDPNVVYLAAGMYFGVESGIWRSADRGANWWITPVPFKMGGNEDGRGLGERLAVDPNQRSTLFFGSRHDGLWRSDDSGATWRKVESFPHRGLGPPEPRTTHAGISFVLFDRSRPGSIYAAVADPGAPHLFQSTDGGRNWRPVRGEPPADMLPVRADIDEAGNLYIAYATGIGPNGIQDGSVWRLDTRTGRWSDITPDPASEGGYMGLSVDRTQPGRLAVSSINRWIPGDTIWVSSDQGRSWTDLKPRSRRDISISPWLRLGEEEPEFGHWTAGLAIDPFDGGAIAYTTGATLYRTNDGLNDRILWRPWVRGIEQTAVITLISPTGGAHIISGFGDIAGFVHDRFDVSPNGIHLNPWLNNTNNLDYAGLAPNIVVRSGSRHKPEPEGASLAWSDDGGRNWQPLKAPAIGGARFDANGEAPITVLADGRTFLVTGPKLLGTGNRGRSWFEPTGLPAGARAYPDKANANLVYAIDFRGERLFVSRDGARSFRQLAAVGLPENLAVEQPRNREAQPILLATPGSAGELWFKVNGELFRSQDAGASFARATGREMSIELFGLGKAGPGRSAPSLYAIGTKSGIRAVWRSDDGGANWVRINDDQNQWGLRFRAISGDPRIHGRAYVATDGRGIFVGDPAARRSDETVDQILQIFLSPRRRP